MVQGFILLKLLSPCGLQFKGRGWNELESNYPFWNIIYTLYFNFKFVTLKTGESIS